VRFCLLPFLSVLLLALPARSATVLVLQFHNNSTYSDLDWVGESIAETLITEFGVANEIVLNRASRAEAIRRLSLRPNANYTKATLIRLGETLDADYICFGNFELDPAAGDAQLKDSSIRISAQFIDLRKMHFGPELSEAGKISELSRLEEHLAYESLVYLEPHAALKLDDFISPRKTIRLDAEESYVRGLLSGNKEQKQKWFLQASAVDPKFQGPAFELGKLALDQKQYAQAMDWFGRIAAGDPNYTEARFKMGLAAYGTGEYARAADYFREVVKTFPLSEVYNNLGAAEDALNQPNAADDFRHALESDPNNPAYLFNLGLTLLKSGAFEEAAKRFQQVADKNPADTEAHALLDQARGHESSPQTGTEKAPLDRLKGSFNETAFRQLKAMLQPSSGR
jgi:tetratricopeptide (TPR) repeat protein